ncbi:MAG TPA: response regulator, partial [Vicinamibacterales bacterium]|nr:response regulator [Vicinamibacterales bacterium]
MADPIRVLVVDDDLAHAEMVVEFLRLTGAWADADIDTASSYEDALNVLTINKYDLAFFDYLLGSRDGLALLREVRQQGITTPVVVLTSRGAEDVAVEAMKAGAADYLS